MYSLLDALSRGENIMTKSFAGSSAVDADNGFGRVFSSALRGANGGLKDVLAGLRERFPAAKVKEGEVGAGVEESVKAADADADKVSDQVTVGSSLLEGMLGNESLAKMVEDAIAGFLEGTAVGGMTSMNGAYVQRSVTITITTVRYTEIQRSQENGDILAASELQTSLQEKIREMMRQLFGVGDESGDADSADAEKAADKTAAAKATDRSNWSGASVNMWSVELYYSMASIQAQGATGSGSGSYAGFQFSAGYSQFSAMASGQIPSLLSDYANGGSGKGSLADILEEVLASFGMSGGGYRETGEGIFFKVSQSRNLIAELMEMYGDRIGGGKPAEAEAAEAAVETAAEVVGAAV